NETIMRAPFPTGYTDEAKSAWGLTADVYDFVNAKRAMITDLRALRAEYKVPPAKFVDVTIHCRDAETAARLVLEYDSLKKAMRAQSLVIDAETTELAMPGKLGALGTVYLSLEG
ncbi:MAG TPA: hypothetical protein DD637_00120, partial [Verrucomicrobia bacterium]|nr:hypothetical protein [Verrucomicrobiota bacterium]